MTWAALAVVLAAAAAALVVPTWGSAGLRKRRRPRSSYLLLGAAAAAGSWWLVGEPRLVVLTAVAAGAVAAGARMVTRHRADREAGWVRGQVVELCDALQAELSAGQTPSIALDRAAGEWPALAPVSRVAASGGDVPTALRELSTGPGAGDLRIVAAAWQVAHRTGHGLGDAVARIAHELREAEHTRRVVVGELASARATARLVAGLPVVALLMGSGAGADPWSFLLGHPLGLACLAGGLAFGMAGLAWIEALARDVERGR